MKRLLRWMALAVWLALPALVAHAVSNPSEMLADPATEARAQDIGKQLRCMVCQNESVEESEADLARDFRKIIRARLQDGATDRQVMEWMTARYGSFIRLRPPFNALTAALWASPVLALGIGLGFVLLSRRRPGQAPAPLTEAERTALEKLGSA